MIEGKECSSDDKIDANTIEQSQPKTRTSPVWEKNTTSANLSAWTPGFPRGRETK